MKVDIREYLTSRGIEWEESTNLREVVAKCDVVYSTRIHRERFGERIDLYKEACGKYIVDHTMLNVLQKHAVIDVARGVFNGLPAIDLISIAIIGGRGVVFGKNCLNTIDFEKLLADRETLNDDGSLGHIMNVMMWGMIFMAFDGQTIKFWVASE
ncbi:aspartate carbamoyltransferase, chloroplastic-like [Aristolochia californica]|uniref:aspartate carbamoyltransferase, chloroplastic-like n=1 Tax=Aristolochia californica TaxID=171875 RepID=UPI0035DE4835